MEVKKKKNCRICSFNYIHTHTTCLGNSVSIINGHLNLKKNLTHTSFFFSQMLPYLPLYFNYQLQLFPIV